MKKDLDAEQFEAELKALRPTPPRTELCQRVLGMVAAGQRRERRPDWSAGINWLLPALSLAALVAFLIVRLDDLPPRESLQARLTTTVAPLKADNVEIDRQWLANFDAIGSLPGGQPVRFRCAQWLDTVWVRDSAAGLVLERTTPRVEIVPLGFETY